MPVVLCESVKPNNWSVEVISYAMSCKKFPSARAAKKDIHIPVTRTSDEASRKVYVSVSGFRAALKNNDPCILDLALGGTVWALESCALGYVFQAFSCEDVTAGKNDWRIGCCRLLL